MRRKQTRNAGRKRKADEMHLTVKDVREMMSVKRPEEIYHTLGISKAIYYRRVAQMKEKSDLYSFCCSVTRNTQEAEDLYQDTFLKRYEMKETLFIRKNPKSFLMSVSVNLYRNYKRKRSVRQNIVGAECSLEVLYGRAFAKGNLSDFKIA